MRVVIAFKPYINVWPDIQTCAIPSLGRKPPRDSSRVRDGHRAQVRSIRTRPAAAFESGSP